MKNFFGAKQEILFQQPLRRTLVLKLLYCTVRIIIAELLLAISFYISGCIWFKEVAISWL
jgi:hypothetical protein